MTSYTQEIYRIKSSTAKIAQAIPETIRAFYALSCASSTDVALDPKTNHKKNFESVASQRFQNFSWFGFEGKAL
jgi:hypothetical protein